MNKVETKSLFLSLLESKNNELPVIKFEELSSWNPCYIDKDIHSNEYSITTPQGIEDLLTLIDDKYLEKTTINKTLLQKIAPELKRLHRLIGMHHVKNHILEHIMYYLQKLNNDNDYLHTVIYGPPGTGKTELAYCIGKIFKDLGALSNGTFKKVTRSDLIAGYLGQTSIKTKSVIESSIGGVLFIDEAYSLGNTEKRDSFSKECIDTLCEMLSHHKNDLMVIIAGYEYDLQECFFSANKGMESRFPWQYYLEKYSHNELFQILEKKIRTETWSLDHASIPKIKQKFEKEYKHFRFQGRDMEQLFSNMKISHSKRIFGMMKGRKTMNYNDFKSGLQRFKDSMKSIKTEENAFNMYS